MRQESRNLPGNSFSPAPFRSSGQISDASESFALEESWASRAPGGRLFDRQRRESCPGCRPSLRPSGNLRLTTSASDASSISRPGEDRSWRRTTSRGRWRNWKTERRTMPLPPMRGLLFSGGCIVIRTVLQITIAKCVSLPINKAVSNTRRGPIIMKSNFWSYSGKTPTRTRSAKTVTYVKRIRLSGFRGILAPLEIDFVKGSNCQSAILYGANGTGKTP